MSYLKLQRKYYLSSSTNEIEDLISTLISIFFSCLSPNFLHYLLFPNIVHLSSLYIKHSRLFHPNIRKQYKQKENSSFDAIYYSSKISDVVHTQFLLTYILFIFWLPPYYFIQRLIIYKAKWLLSVLVKPVMTPLTTLILKTFFSHPFQILIFPAFSLPSLMFSAPSSCSSSSAWGPLLVLLFVYMWHLPVCSLFSPKTTKLPSSNNSSSLSWSRPILPTITPWIAPLW